MPLVFDVKPAMAEADFLVGDCNRIALSWVERWPDWSARALLLHGPPGSGKTHLLGIWARRAGVEVHLDGGTLAGIDPDAAIAVGAAVTIDRADMAAGEATAEQTLFHLINLARERRCSLLIAARRPAADWGVALADLSSRLKALPHVELGAPDDAMLGGVLIKLFSDRQLLVDKSVLDFLLARMDRSFEAAGEVVRRLDEAALADRRAITVPFARRVLFSGIEE